MSKQIILILIVFSLNCFAMDKVDTDYDCTFHQVENAAIEEFFVHVDSMIEQQPNENITTMPAHDQIRPVAQDLAGFYAINEQAYKALFANEHYQLLVMNSGSFERFKGEKTFKPLKLDVAAQLLNKTQLQMVAQLHLQQQEKQKKPLFMRKNEMMREGLSNMKNLFTQALFSEASPQASNTLVPCSDNRVDSSTENKVHTLGNKTIKMPTKEVLQKRLENAIGNTWIPLVEKTNIVSQLADQQIKPLGIAIAIEFAIDDYAEKLSQSVMPELRSEMLMALKPVILEALLKDEPAALEELKQMGFYKPIHSKDKGQETL